MANFIDITDESKYQWNLRRVDAALRSIVDPSERTFRVQLTADPEPLGHQVRVEIDKDMLGELPYKVAKEYWAATLARHPRVVTCLARLDGGGHKPFAVTVDLDSLKASLDGSEDEPAF